MAMENRTGAGSGLKSRITQILKTHKPILLAVGAAISGAVMAGSNIFGSIAPFGVSFCAALPAPLNACAAVGAILGYIFAPAQPDNMQYIAALILVLTLRWLLGSKTDDRRGPLISAAIGFLSLTVAGAVVVYLSRASLYDILFTVAEVFLCGGAAYFFSRTLLALETGLETMSHADQSCMVITFAVVIMGLDAITLGSLSVGRVLAIFLILYAARSGNEAGGAVAGITAGMALGLSGGDTAFTLVGYGFGGLIAGVFSGLGRVGSAAAFIVTCGVAALFTKTAGHVYTALFETFIASIAFVALPQSLFTQLRLRSLTASSGDAAAQSALQSRLLQVSDALREIGHTTREVGQRLRKMESGGLEEIGPRTVSQICDACGRRNTCWQLQYADSARALNNAVLRIKQEGAVHVEHLPESFVQRCCKPETFVGELNIQFQSHLARESAQRKVSLVREVVTDQFDGMAMLLEEMTGPLCGVDLLEPSSQRRVRDYFDRSGFSVQQVRCFTDRAGRATVELTIPAYQRGRLEAEESAADLSAILDIDLDPPYVDEHRKYATAVFCEKARYTAEMGACQLRPDGNRLCGDAYAAILNRGGTAHFLISDGMGSGGGAAVDANLATDLLTRLITVGFGHESALKIVNSALLIKSGEESLATIDVCSADLYTGRVDFYKAGAAPTFVIRRGRVGHVESTSLPAGILQGVSFDHSCMTLGEDDVLVMVSDGVVATGVDWVKSELGALGSGDLQRLADKLAMTAKVRRTDRREDDITVLAVALRKGIA